MKLLLAAVGIFALAWAVGTDAGRATVHPGDPVARRTVVLGRSVDGRPIVAIETGDLDSERTALVVGCIHGNECAGIAVAQRLTRMPVPHELALWVIPNLNPDGAAAGTRDNAHGVDLNRNFPWGWQPLHGLYDSGPAPLSERETRIVSRLILRVRPSVSIWFHQHLDVVDDSSGNAAIERRFAAVAGMRVAPLAREPGSAVGWEAHCLPGASAFVVELPAGPVAAQELPRLTSAVSGVVTASPDVRATRRARGCRADRPVGR